MYSKFLMILALNANFQFYLPDKGWLIILLLSRHYKPQNPGVVSRSAEQKQKVYYPRVSAEAEDVRYTIRGFGVLIKNDFEV